MLSVILTALVILATITCIALSPKDNTLENLNYLTKLASQENLTTAIGINSTQWQEY